MVRAVCDSSYLRVYYIYSEYLDVCCWTHENLQRLTVNSFIQLLRIVMRKNEVSLGILYVTIILKKHSNAFQFSERVSMF